ncbi:MAG: hypothetical protein ABR562_07990 [Thermoplasmatota archaeon]
MKWRPCNEGAAARGLSPMAAIGLLSIKHKCVACPDCDRSGCDTCDGQGYVLPCGDEDGA